MFSSDGKVRAETAASFLNVLQYLQSLNLGKVVQHEGQWPVFVKMNWNDLSDKAKKCLRSLKVPSLSFSFAGLRHLHEPCETVLPESQDIAESPPSQFSASATTESRNEEEEGTAVNL